jgi:hypothetical protein
MVVSQLHSTRDLQTMSLFILFSICAIYCTLSGDGRAYFPLAVGSSSSRRPTADDLTTPNFPPAAQFAAQKERTKSG